MDENILDKINFGDNRKRVLILGNGVSRKDYLYVQQNWHGAIYGCNWIFKELIDGILPKLDILIGDRNAIKEANKYQKQYGYRILGKHTKSFVLPNVEKPLTPSSLIADSGSTITIHALMEGYDEIWLCGFDLGGKDIYIKNHDKRNKYRWIETWRRIARIFGLHKIHFIGKDHKPFILSGMPADTYARAYLNGIDHLTGVSVDNIKDKEEQEKYDKRLEQQQNNKVDNRVLILGNGTSRTKSIERRFIQNWKGEIWICNRAYKEYKKLPRINRIGTLYKHIANEAFTFIKEHNIQADIYVDFLKQSEDYKLFNLNKGFSTGNELVLQAIHEGYKIWLLGFDFAGDSIYKDKATDGRRYRNEFCQIRDEFGLENIIFVNQEFPKFLRIPSWRHTLKMIEANA